MLPLDELLRQLRQRGVSESTIAKVEFEIVKQAHRDRYGPAQASYKAERAKRGNKTPLDEPALQNWAFSYLSKAISPLALDLHGEGYLDFGEKMQRYANNNLNANWEVEDSALNKAAKEMIARYLIHRSRLKA